LSVSVEHQHPRVHRPLTTEGALVPHVELSLSEATEPAAPRPGGFDGSLDRWAFAVSSANEPCLVTDAGGLVVAASPGCRGLLATSPAEAVGRRLVSVLRPLDFNAVSGELPDWEAEKIPPLMAISSGGLARGLLRLPDDRGAPRTVDAVSAPLRDGSTVVGSITYFALVNR